MRPARKSGKPSWERQDAIASLLLFKLKNVKEQAKDKKQPVDAWTQRTEKPLARLLLFNGFTTPELKPRLPALALPAA